MRTAVKHGDDVCRRSIHHESGIGRDEKADRGVAVEAPFNPPPAKRGKMRFGRGGGALRKEVGRDF